MLQVRGLLRIIGSSMRYELILAEAATGIVLNEDGNWHLSGQPRYAPSYATLSEALAQKGALLARLPLAEVVIYDSDSGTVTRYVREPDGA
jgi:hypothetical protein